MNATLRSGGPIANGTWSKASIPYFAKPSGTKEGPTTILARHGNMLRPTVWGPLCENMEN